MMARGWNTAGGVEGRLRARARGGVLRRGPGRGPREEEGGGGQGRGACPMRGTGGKGFGKGVWKGWRKGLGKGLGEGLGTGSRGKGSGKGFGKGLG